MNKIHQAGVVIALGSSSDIKKQAVKEAFPEAAIHGFEVGTGVQPQPVGKEMTYEGAKWRANAAKAKLPTADYFIGIENGMYERDGHEKKYDYRKRPLEGNWLDVAAIVILHKDGEIVLWSDTIEIPADAQPSEDGEWSYRKDPHAWLTDNARPRAKFLGDCLRRNINSKRTFSNIFPVNSYINFMYSFSAWFICCFKITAVIDGFDNYKR